MRFMKIDRTVQGANIYISSSRLTNRLETGRQLVLITPGYLSPTPITSTRISGLDIALLDTCQRKNAGIIGRTRYSVRVTSGNTAEEPVFSKSMLAILESTVTYCQFPVSASAHSMCTTL